MGEKDRKSDKSEREREIGREMGVGERNTGERERDTWRKRGRDRRERQR